MKRTKEKNKNITRLFVIIMATLLLAVFALPTLTLQKQMAFGAEYTDVASLPQDQECDMTKDTWIDLNNELDDLVITHRHFADSVYTSHEYPYRELPAGNYYLSANLGIDCALRVNDDATVNFNLNGYELYICDGPNNYQNGNGALEVGNSDESGVGGTLNIYDTIFTGSSGSFVKYAPPGGGYGSKYIHSVWDGRYPTNKSARVDITGGVITGVSTVIDDIHTLNVETGGTLNFYGGTVAGSYADHGGGLYVHDGGTANMFEGATISNNFANFYGAVESCGELNIFGGAIKDNLSMRECGVVFIDGGTISMYNGVISGNESGRGTVKVMNGGTFIMKGGSIEKNFSEENGGGINVIGGTCEISALDVDNPPTIKENVTEIRGGGICVSNGTLEIDGALIDSNSTRSWRGSGNGGGICAFNESTVTIKNADITNNTSNGKSTYENERYGYIASAGGGICLHESDLTLGGDVKISGNKSQLDGGGLDAYGESSITIETGANIDVSNNTSQTEGGGIRVEGGSSFKNEGTLEIKENNATTGGGGLYLSNGSKLDNDGIINVQTNTSGASGGGVNVFSSSTIQNDGTITIENNTSVTDGGGLYLYGNANLQNGGEINVNDNKSQADGGGVNAYGGVRIQNDGDINIDGNSAVANGGGMQLTGSSVVTNNGEFNIGEDTNKNEAENGGGIYLEQGSSIFNNSDLNITDNKAQTNGGGTFLTQSSKIINNDSLDISDNTAETNGGGIYGTQGGMVVNIGEADIDDNEAENGGGACLDVGGTLNNMGDMDICGNDATENGGGVAVSGGVLQCDSVNITNNTADGTGGGVYQNNVMAVEGEVVVTDNTAGESVPKSEDNVALGTGRSIYLTDSLDEGSHVGVNVPKPVLKQTVVDGAGGYDVKITDDFFTYDGDNAQYIANHGIEDGDGSPHIMLLSEGPDLFKPHICENPVTPGTQDGWYPIYMIEDTDVDGKSNFYVSNMPYPAKEGDIIPPGYYYLANDIEITQSIPIDNDVHICMNGHDIVAKGVDDSTPATYPVFEVGRDDSEDSTQLDGTGGILNLYGHIKSSTPSYGQWVGDKYVIVGSLDDTTGGFNKTQAYDTIGGGYVTGGNGGVEVLDGASFNMHGGTIAGNATTDNGGGVLVREGGSLNVQEGAIMGNKAVNGGGIYAEGKVGETDVILDGNYAFVKNNRATNGGGVYLADNAKMEMHGNSDVVDNQATTGGGVYVDETAELKITYGVISANKAETAGGVYMDGKLDVSGSTNISSNKDTDDTGANTQKRSNVYLPDDKTITISGELGIGAHIGVLTESADANSDPKVEPKVAVSDGTHPITYLDGHYIVSDDIGFAANRVGDDLNAEIQLIGGEKENFVGHRCEDGNGCHYDCNSKTVETWLPIVTLHDLENMVAEKDTDNNGTAEKNRLLSCFQYGNNIGN